MKTVYVAFFLAVLFLWPVSIAAQQNANVETNLPADVLVRLKKQQKALNIIALEYAQRIADPAFVDGGGQNTRREVYIEGRRFHTRIERFATADTSWTSPLEVSEISFDGTFLHRLSKPQGMFRKSSIQEDNHTNYLGTGDLVFVRAAGLHVPARLQHMADFVSVEPLVLKLLRESSSTKVERVENRFRVTVRIPHQPLLDIHATDSHWLRERMKKLMFSDEKIQKRVDAYTKMKGVPAVLEVVLSLDPAYGYAVVSREDFLSSGKRVANYINEEWKHFPEVDLWLPQRSVVLGFTKEGIYEQFSDYPITTNVMELKTVSFEKRDVRFALDAAPGMIVVDESNPQNSKVLSAKNPPVPDDESWSRTKLLTMFGLLLLAISLAPILGKKMKG